MRYGLEGVNYEYLEGSDDIIVTNGSYTSGFTYAGDESIMLIQYPGDESYIANKQTMEERAFISPLCGYMFDDSKYQTEAAIIYAAILEYLPTLQNGMYASEEETLAMIDAFNKKLEASGINEIIAANQEQLDAYLSAQ